MARARPCACAAEHGPSHHGALQRGVQLVEAIGAAALPGADLRDLLRAWSPGTAALLDYDDATGEGNPVLFEMNERLRCTRPERGMGLVGGTDGDFVSDFLSVGDVPNDRVVPLWSAFAQKDSRHTVSALAALGSGGLETETELFNHFDVGKETGENPQPIGDFADESILPRFSDWVVSTIQSSEFTPKEPEPGEPQTVEAQVTVDFNVPHEDIKGVALLLYVQDGDGEWRVADGADPETLDVTKGVDVSGNSADREVPLVLSAEAELPVPEPGQPETQTEDIDLVLFPVVDGKTTVPAEPEGAFGLPE